MRFKNLWIVLLVAVLSSCDDGDILVTSFDFDDATLENCGGVGTYVFFKINPLSSESISLRLGTSDSIFFDEGIRQFQLNGTSNFVNYRTYTEAPSSSYFCSSIPPTEPDVVQNYLGDEGEVTLDVTINRDDNDGIDEDNSLSEDTDADGLLNYFDFDDDGDNVPTALEIGLDPANPRDTDGDGIADYLDNDDDNDGVLTINEDANMDLDPTNDITDPAIGANYLNPNVAKSFIIKEFIEHSYDTDSSIELFVNNLVLTNGSEQLNLETFEFGNIENVASGTVLITPEFN